VPPIFLDVVQVASVAREGVTVTGGIYAPPAELLGFCVGEVPVVPLVEDTIGVGAS
jgi:hypothetical protein